MFLSYWNMFKIDFPTILHFHNLLKLNSKHAPVLLNTLNKINSLQFFTCFFGDFFSSLLNLIFVVALSFLVKFFTYFVCCLFI